MKNSDYFGAIDWWERRRLKYNLIILIAFVAFSYGYLERWESISLDDITFNVILIFALANVYYTIGWIIEVLISYYAGRINFNVNRLLAIIVAARHLTFFIGCFISIFFAIGLLYEELIRITP
ncbi:MAG: hypothetical protein ACI8VT_003740 [Saprospiraceae bacterium]|jgi:hypothetical protein